jgi:hypothetical protein
MKRLLTHLLPIGMIAALVVGAFVPGAALALTPRSPQIGFSSATLQAYLTSKSQTITVTTDQVDQQVWTTSLSGNSTFTIMAQLTPIAPAGPTGNEIGVYNTPDLSPVLFTVLPKTAGVDWYATVHFGSGGTLSVSLFNNLGVFQSTTGYTGVNQSKFGFYIKGAGGTFYSQDWRNGGKAQVLTYAGTGTSFGTWWECFEDSPYDAGTSDFDDAILNLQSVVTTPAHSRSWGSVKLDGR